MPEATTRQATLRLGAGCTVAGALAIAGFRLNHGDLPAADAPAALRFIADHPFYAGVHIGTILGVLAWAAAAPADRPGLELAARTAFTIPRGTSLSSILVLWGIPLLLLRRALPLEAYPSWLGRTGVAAGAATVLAALALLFREDPFPGALLYGLLVSILVPLWSFALGLAMWRRAATVGAEP